MSPDRPTNTSRHDTPRKRWVSPLITALILLVYPMYAAEIGRIIALEGQAIIKSAAGREVPVALKSPVNQGDTITTRDASKLQISLADDSIIAMGEHSSLVMDEFIYAGPDSRKEEVSCVVSATKGILRMITGKITDLNPDRFKVKTHLATIGIRGCDVGFRIDPWEEQVYALFLPAGHALWISPFIADQGTPMNGMLDTGMLATLRVGETVQTRFMETGDALKLIQDSSPGNLNSGSTGDESPPDPPPAEDPSSEASRLTIAVVQSESLDNLAPPPVVQPDVPASEDLPPLPESGPTDAPYVAPPVTEPPVLVGGHPVMDDWAWGIWENGDLQYDPNTYVGASFLSDTDFATIAGGTTPYDLSGSGAAAAALQDHLGGETRIVQGSCLISVLVGNTPTPAWGGSFTMNNGTGDSLDFTVDRASVGGGFQPDGSLSLNALTTYNMTVNTHTYDNTTLTGQSVEGRLVTPGVGIAPISGVTGGFHFQHGTDASADGAFGATF